MLCYACDFGSIHKYVSGAMAALFNVCVCIVEDGLEGKSVGEERVM